MAVKVEVTPPAVREVTIKIDEKSAGLLMKYIVDNGSWTSDKGGPEAESLFFALERAGIEEA